MKRTLAAALALLTSGCALAEGLPPVAGPYFQGEYAEPRPGQGYAYQQQHVVPHAPRGWYGDRRPDSLLYRAGPPVPAWVPERDVAHFLVPPHTRPPLGWCPPPHACAPPPYR